MLNTLVQPIAENSKMGCGTFSAGIIRDRNAKRIRNVSVFFLISWQCGPQFRENPPAQLINQTLPPKSPPLTFHTPLLLFCPRRPAHAVAVLLIASGSEDSQGPDTGNRRVAFRGTPENVGRQGLRQASGSIYLQAAPRGECCSKLGHGSGQRRRACSWPHAHHEASYAHAANISRS
jgi:hypothetical protein